MSLRLNLSRDGHLRCGLGPLATLGLALLVGCGGAQPAEPEPESTGGASGEATGGAGPATGGKGGGKGGTGGKEATGGAGGKEATGGTDGEGGAGPDAGEPPEDAADEPADAASGDASKADAKPPTDGPPPSGYNPCATKGKACVLLPLGDSLTQGAGSSGGGYRVELFRQAVTHGKAFTTVGSAGNGPAEINGVPFPKRHEGHGGFSIGDISTWITDHDTIAMYKPDVVMLSLGTNGLKYATSNVADQLKQLGALVDKIVAADPHLLVVVAQIIPMNTDVGTKNVMAYNAGIPALVKERLAAGKHVAVANIYAGFVANPNWKTEYLPNGLHPGDPGYAAMGKAWYGAIGPLLP